MRSIVKAVVYLRRLGLILIASLVLSGCVHYDTGIHFKDASHGEIIQSIRLDRSAAGLGSSVLTAWLATLEQQAQQLGGKTRHPSPQELVIRVPFAGGRDLATKFNQLLQSQSSSRSPRAFPSQSQDIASQLHLSTYNLILWQRHHLNYDLDLRPLQLPVLPPEATEGTIPALDLQFSLRTPWGATLAQPNTPMPVTKRRGRQLIWQLQPGAINHIEAIFWVPSPLGIGTVGIGAIVLTGMYLKSRQTKTSLHQEGG